MNQVLEFGSPSVSRRRQAVQPTGEESQAELARSYGHRRAKAIMTQRELARATGGAAAPVATKGVPEFAPTPQRLARGKFEHTDITQTVFERDATGDRKEGRKHLMGRQYTDSLQDVETRLWRIKGLCLDQINAGVTFDAEWRESGLEPRLTANLLGVGGGKPKGPSDTAGKARIKVHEALKALRLGGDEVVRVTEAVILGAESPGSAGWKAYEDKGRAIAHANACLNVGLNLLAAHYKLRPATPARTKCSTEAA